MARYNFPALIAAIPTQSLAELKSQRDRARRIADELGTAGARDYFLAVETAIAEIKHREAVATTPTNEGVTQADIELLWRGIEHAERVLTELNPKRRSGNRRKHLLSRTRQRIQRLGAGPFLIKEYSTDERAGRMQPAWARNLWALLSTGHSDYTIEDWRIKNAARLTATNVGTAHDMMIAIWPIFGLEVPARPAHASPIHERAIARMRRQMTEELLSLGTHSGVKLPDTLVFNEERLSITTERNEALKRADFRCQHPGCDVNDVTMLHVHHVVHRSRGGSDSRDNLLVLCANHHSVEHRKRLKGTFQ